jgi:hypothetical protein
LFFNGKLYLAFYYFLVYFDDLFRWHVSRTWTLLTSVNGSATFLALFHLLVKNFANVYVWFLLSSHKLLRFFWRFWASGLRWIWTLVITTLLCRRISPFTYHNFLFFPYFFSFVLSLTNRQLHLSFCLAVITLFLVRIFSQNQILVRQLL